jgi:hypothetical protein
MSYDFIFFLFILFGLLVRGHLRLWEGKWLFQIDSGLFIFFFPGPSCKTLVTHRPSWGEAPRCDESLELPHEWGLRLMWSEKAEEEHGKQEAGWNRSTGCEQRVGESGGDLAMCQDLHLPLGRTLTPLWLWFWVERKKVWSGWWPHSEVLGSILFTVGVIPWWLLAK